MHSFHFPCKQPRPGAMVMGGDERRAVFAVSAGAFCLVLPLPRSHSRPSTTYPNEITIRILHTPELRAASSSTWRDHHSPGFGGDGAGVGWRTEARTGSRHLPKLTIARLLLFLKLTILCARFSGPTSAL